MASWWLQQENNQETYSMLWKMVCSIESILNLLKHVKPSSILDFACHSYVNYTLTCSPAHQYTPSFSSGSPEQIAYCESFCVFSSESFLHTGSQRKERLVLNLCRTANCFHCIPTNTDSNLP